MIQIEIVMQDVNDYTNAALKFQPKQIKVLFIAESPPAYQTESRKSYFYFAPNPGGDVLFATIIYAIYGVKYFKKDGSKSDLLRRFQNDGYWLQDAVGFPINRVEGKIVKGSDRARLIQDKIPELIDRLESLKRDKLLLPDTGLILIKKVVFETLSIPLVKAGYNVLHNSMIGFPGYHRDKRTVAGIRNAINKMSGK